MSEADLFSTSYDYTLPPEAIAHHPMTPRESAKLLVYNRQSGSITHTTIGKLPLFIPQNAAVIFNNTKVFKARLWGQKESGGKIEVLILRPLAEDNLFLAYIRGKVSEGAKLFFEEGLSAEVVECYEDGSRSVVFIGSNRCILSFEELFPYLEKCGHIPLPPYISRPDNDNDESDYQSIFAKHIGSVAAPTASLHFTPPLLEEIMRTHPTGTLTLHVGAGTFKGVEVEAIENHTMHAEFFSLPHETCNLIHSDTPLLAIGTTATRVIENFVRTGQQEGECTLFLHPHNPPQRVNHLLTNFHLPKSTLIMLVSSFIGREKTLELYQAAIHHNYRFFSYGDAMLIL